MFYLHPLHPLFLDETDWQAAASSRTLLLQLPGDCRETVFLNKGGGGGGSFFWVSAAKGVGNRPARPPHTHPLCLVPLLGDTFHLCETHLTPNTAKHSPCTTSVYFNLRALRTQPSRLVSPTLDAYPARPSADHPSIGRGAGSLPISRLADQSRA